MRLDAFPPRRRQLISLTPLIDVVFILLLFFMLSSTFMRWRQVDVSAAVSVQESTKEVRMLRLSAADEGVLSFEQQTYALADQAALKTLIAQDSEAVYALDVEAGVKTQSMINALDELKRAGAASVSLAGVIQ